MEVDRGRIEDGPWALLLAELGRSGTTAQLTIKAADKVYALALANGAIVGATSPMAVDSVARIASTLQLPPASMQHRGLARGHIDRELESYTNATNLSPDQLRRLKRRILVQRAARTFALEKGTYTLSSRVAIPVMLGVEVDVRAVVFSGALLHLDGGRMIAGFSVGASRFSIAGDALTAFEFSDADQPILAALRAGSSAPEIEAKHRELDPRRVQAVFYALATCGALAKQERELPKLARGSVEMEPVGPEDCVPMLIRKDPEVACSSRAAPRLPQPSSRPLRAVTEASFEARPTTLRPNALGASELVTLISTRSLAASRGAHHFAILGVPVGASVEQVRTAYMELSRNLRTERLFELKIRDPEYRARSLLAQVCIAYTVLTDPVRRAEYVSNLKRHRTPSMLDLDFGRLAREAYARGTLALRSDAPELAVIELRTACELAPNDISYIATLGHAEFCAAATAPRPGPC